MPSGGTFKRGSMTPELPGLEPQVATVALWGGLGSVLAGLILLPFAALVGDAETEFARLGLATGACVAAALTCGLSLAMAPRSARALIVAAGGAVRVLTVLVILSCAALTVGWLVSVTTLVYSGLIYIALVAFQSGAAIRGRRELDAAGASSSRREAGPT